MGNGATVMFESAVPVWEFPEMLAMTTRAATYLDTRLGGGVSVKLQYIKIDYIDRSGSGYEWVLCAELAWRNNVFAEIRGSHMKTVRAINRYHRDHCTTIHSTDELTTFLVAILQKRGRELLEDLDVERSQAKFLTELER